MAGKRARDHRTNIACLESLWNSDLENRLSVVPILDLVSRVNGTRYTYLTCNTREELAYNLGKLGKRRGYRDALPLAARQARASSSSTAAEPTSNRSRE